MQATAENAKQSWQRAMKRADGEKVFDDPKLLKKSIKREDQKKRKSGREWYKCDATGSLSGVTASEPSARLRRSVLISASQILRDVLRTRRPRRWDW